MGDNLSGLSNEELQQMTPGAVWRSPEGKVARSWLKWIIGGIFALIIFGGAISLVGGFVGGWFNAGTHIFSAENVTQQFQDAYSRYTALQATCSNYENANQAYDAAVRAGDSQDVTVQYQEQVNAYFDNFTRISADYNAAYDNAFQAALVGPKDLPKHAPTIQAMEANGCQ